jgi:hypothetical protein
MIPSNSRGNCHSPPSPGKSTIVAVYYTLATGAVWFGIAVSVDLLRHDVLNSGR